MSANGRRKWILAAALVAATLLAYVPSIRGGFIWDDDFYVTGNVNLRSAEGLRAIWLDRSATPQYYPVTHTSFWIEYHLWGLDPLGYHVVNVLLHAAAAILFALILESLGIPGAWLAAAVFALHPVHVESVAWITERKNTLSGVFYLGAALAFLRADRSPRGRPVALALYIAAVLSKSVAASLPVALAIVLFWKRGRLDRRETRWLAAMLVFGAVAGLQTAFLERVQVGAEGRDFDLSLAERTLVAGRAVWFYLGKLAWPARLSFVYEKWSIDAGAWIPWLFPAALVASFAALWALRDRIGKGALAAFAFFVMTLFPALGFLNVYPMRYSFVADHFQYLASLGPIALAAAAASRASARARRAAPALAASILLALGARTWAQGHAYADLDTLWRHTIASSPKAFMAHYNLGKMLAEKGRVDEAIAHYEEALRAKPDLVEGIVNLANAYADRHRTEEAIGMYRRALAIDPRWTLAHYNLGLALEEAGRPGEALEAYRGAIEVDPRFGAAYNNMAILLFRKGDFAAAWAAVRAARANGVAPHPEFLRALAERMPDPGRSGR